MPKARFSGSTRKGDCLLAARCRSLVTSGTLYRVRGSRLVENRIPVASPRRGAMIMKRAGSVDRRIVWALISVALWVAGAPTKVRAQSPQAPLNTVVPAPIDVVPPKIDFDVVSFKRCPPDKYGTTKVDMPMTADYLAYHCESLSRIIYFAYYGSIKVYSLDGYPKWVDDDRYEFIVKVAPEDFPAWQKLDLPARRLVIRTVLADTVKLKIRVDNSPKAIYALTATKKLNLTPYKQIGRASCRERV